MNNRRHVITPSQIQYWAHEAMDSNDLQHFITRCSRFDSTYFEGLIILMDFDNEMYRRMLYQFDLEMEHTLAVLGF